MAEAGENEGGGEAEGSQVPAEVQAEAKEMGWRDKPEFKGKVENWVDADVYVERSKTLAPLLKKHNAKLESQVTQLTGEVSRLTKVLEGSQDSIKALEEFHSEETTRRVKKARADLLEELKTAKTNENIEDEVRITDELTKLNVAETRSEAREDKKKPADKVDDDTKVDNTQQPWFKEFRRENPWFGVDRRRTALMQGISDDLRLNGETAVGKEFLDMCVEELEKVLPLDGGKNRSSRVEGGGRPSGSNGGGGKSYSDLPADAKAACEHQAARLVGEGRAFKTKDAWKKYYVNKYFEEDNQ